MNLELYPSVQLPGIAPLVILEGTLCINIGGDTWT